MTGACAAPPPSLLPLGQAARPAGADVAYAIHVPPFVAQDVVNHGGCRRFAVGPCDGHHGSGVALSHEHAAGVFDVADDFSSLRAADVHDRGVVRDARAFHHHAGVHPCFRTVPSEFVGDAIGLQFSRAWTATFPSFAYVRVCTHGLRQQGATHAAFAGA